MTLLQEIRKSLNIPNEHHTQWLRELVAAKKSGKLNTRAEFPGKQQPQQVPQQVPPAFLPPQKPQKHEKPKPSTASRPGRVNPAEAAKKAKAQAAAQADAEQQANKKQQPPEGLPSNPVHMKVQFYNKDSGWHEGVVMAYDATEGKVEVALLNSKKREKLDYKKSHCLLVHENELVTDLSNYV